MALLVESEKLADPGAYVQHTVMPGTRILVVEDEPLIRMFVVDTLEDAGFQVEEAGGAVEAMEKMTSGSSSFAAVIIDVGLPDRPGDVLAGELRTKWAQLPLLIASGHDRNELARRFKDDGRIGVLGKPYNSGMLIEALHQVGVTAEKD
jgi:DNA-binding response OmpR family regulator